MARQRHRGESRHQADRATGGTGENRTQTLPKEFVMKIAVVLASSILSFSALNVQAATPVDFESLKVQLSDLDLDHKAGIVVLFQRIKGAAQRVCADQGGKTLIAKRTYATCVDYAVSTAVARIDRPLLTDYVVQQLGKPIAGAPAQVAGR
jgi:UrcA family protein